MFTGPKRQNREMRAEKMSGLIVLKQMIIIFILILTGFVLYKKHLISEYATKDLSALVVNICSPGLILVSVLQDLTTVSRANVLLVGAIGICFYLGMSVVGYLLVKLLKVPGNQKTAYMLMTLFGNTGFIGIPVAMAIIGPKCMVYVIVFNFLYNCYIYTFGIMLLKEGNKGVKNSWKNFLSPGLIACMFAFCIYWFNLRLPEGVETIAGYYGNACTLLSMIVIGISLANMQVKTVLKNKKLMLFIVIRFVIIPVLFAVLLKPLLPDTIMRATIVLMAALPVGNMPAMLSEQYGKDSKLIAEGIIVTTLLSVATITFTFLFI